VPAYGYDLPGRGEFVLTDEQKELITGNVGFAYLLADKYTNRGVPREDLRQEALFAMAIASVDFDPTRGVKFISFATDRIRQRISLLLRISARQIVYPSGVFWEAGMLYKMKESGATIEEMCVRIRKKEKHVNHVLDAIRTNVPYDAEDFVNKPATEDFFGDLEEQDTKEMLAIHINKALAHKDRIRYVIIRYFGLNGQEKSTLDAIGQDLGVTKEYVRQLKNKGLEILRNYFKYRGISEDEFRF